MGVERHPATTPADARFRLGFGVYVGVVFAGAVTTTAALSGRTSTVLAGTFVACTVLGGVTGVLVAGWIDGLPGRLARSWQRRVTLYLPALAFAAVVVAPYLFPLGDHVGPVAFGSTIGILGTARVLAVLAQNRYVEAVTTGEPTLTTQWDPTTTPRLNVALVVLFGLQGAVFAAGGTWPFAVVTIGAAMLFPIDSILTSRWPIGPADDACELRVHEAGLVTVRPYRKSLVPWSDVRRVRLRKGELLLDRRFRYDRFDRDEIAEIESMAESIERALTEGEHR